MVVRNWCAPLVVWAMVVGCGVNRLGAEEPPAVRIAGLAAAGEAAAGEKLAVTKTVLKDLPRVTLEAKDRDGATHRFEGVELHELLKKVKTSTGDDLRGKRMREFVTIDGRDGYSVCFSLAELSPAFTDRKVILADLSDGQPMLDGVGPFRVVVEGEKRHSRWVRDVVAIQVFDAARIPPAPVSK